MMMTPDDRTTYDGEVVTVGTPPRAKQRESTEVVVRIPGTRIPKVGDAVRLIVMRPDEEIGREFREMFRGIDHVEVNELVESLENVGWSILVDLIREVAR